VKGIPETCPSCASWLVPLADEDPAVVISTCSACSYRIVIDSVTSERLVEMMGNFTIEHAEGVVTLGPGRRVRRRFHRQSDLRRLLPWV
jgi:hypothetical protein